RKRRPERGDAEVCRKGRDEGEAPARLDAEPLDGRVDVAGEVAMLDDDAFGLSGRAGGVDDVGGRIGTRGRLERRVVVPGERRVVDEQDVAAAGARGVRAVGDDDART